MSIKCGACQGRHESVAEVRACAGVPTGAVAAPVSSPPASGGSVVLDRLRRQGEQRRPAERPTQVERYRQNEASLADGTRAASRIRQSAVSARRGTDTGWPAGRMATPKMTKYVTDLIAQREIPLGVAVEAEDKTARDALTFDEAHRFIDAYKDAPRKAPAERASLAVGVGATKDGMYRNPDTGEIYKAQFARANGSGGLYAKRLVIESEPERDDDGKILVPAVMEFEYVSGLIREIKPEWRMTLEEASEWGALYGRCLRCSRTLTAEESIERAMGPICAGKANWGE